MVSNQTFVAPRRHPAALGRTCPGRSWRTSQMARVPRSSSMPWPGKERPSEHYQEDLAAILTDRMPAHLGPVAARAIAAFILTTVGATISEATRLRGAGQSPAQIAGTLTDTVGSTGHPGHRHRRCRRPKSGTQATPVDDGLPQHSPDPAPDRARIGAAAARRGPRRRPRSTRPGQPPLPAAPCRRARPPRPPSAVTIGYVLGVVVCTREVPLLLGALDFQ